MSNPEKRLIDANALLKSYDIAWMVEYDETGCGVRKKAIPTKTIEEAPTIDAVEGVRCRECKFAEKTIWSSGEMYCCIWKMNPRPDGYCYLGAKMDVKEE